MDNRATTILASVISDHGNQLLTSDAFCQVYLTGYLADYPEERHLFMALKEHDIPKALLDFKESNIAENDLHNFIITSSENTSHDTDAIAWGVDAWAAAIGLTKAVRQNIVTQYFNCSEQIIDSAKYRPNIPNKQPALVRKTFATASLIGLTWLVPFQGSDVYLAAVAQAPQIKQLVPTAVALEIKQHTLVTVIPKVKSPIAPIAITTRTNATELLQQTLDKSKRAENSQIPKPMVIGKSRNRRTLKTKQLRADIDAYLQFGKISD